MIKLLTIIRKNYKIFTRSKVSALIIFLGPLLLVSLIGMSFSNTQLPGLTVSVYSPNYNDFTDSILTKIQESNFEIDKHDSKTECADSVKKADAAICLVFPENMDKENNEVTFVVDYSKINLVFIVVDIFSSKVSERATELRTTYATEIIDKIVETKDDLTKQQESLVSLKTKQGESKTLIESATSELAEITTTIDFAEGATIADADDSIDSVILKIESAKSKIYDTKDYLESSSLTDNEKETVNAKLDNANSALSNALLYLEGNDTVDSLEYIVDQLDDALASAKAQLETVEKQKTTVKGDLITLQGSVAESLSAVDYVKDSISCIMKNIGDISAEDASQLVSPIKTRIEPVTTPETHFNFLFPTLIVLIIMITAVLLSSTLVMNEKKSKSMFRNIITPTSEFILNLGTFLTSLSAIVLQLLIFLLISTVFFGTNILSSLGPSLLILLLVTSVFILLGMIIGFIFKSEETYVLAAITVSALLLFLSSTVMPIESISDSVRAVASFTPFVVSENLLRQAMFFDFTLLSMLQGLLILIAYIVIFGAAIYGVEKLIRSHITIKRKPFKKN